MSLHPWWDQFGSAVQDGEVSQNGLARDLAALVVAGTLPGVTFAGDPARLGGRQHRRRLRS